MISDRYAPDSAFSQPVKPALTKLLFYCQIVAASNPDQNPFTAFQHFNQSALKVLSTQKSYAYSLLHHPNIHYRREFYLDEDYGGTLDQTRATALPRTPQLIQDSWEKTFPAALKKSGPTQMRKYLRSLTTDDSFLKEMAELRLAQVDQLVIKQYFAQAKALLRKHDFAGTRKKYKQIIAEYPDSDAARRAEAELPKVVPVAIKFYKTEGDKNFNPGKQFGVPQLKAREFFKKMYDEDPEGKSGGSADYALYHWARALGTEGKVKREIELLQLHLEKFPKSKLRAKTLYLLGFTYGNNPLAQHDKAIAIYHDIVKLYPKTEEASEALWQIAFLEGVNSRYDKAIDACQKLVAEYPQSYRYKVAKEWAGRYGELMRSGKKWPG